MKTQHTGNVWMQWKDYSEKLVTIKAYIKKETCLINNFIFYTLKQNERTKLKAKWKK